MGCVFNNVFIGTNVSIDQTIIHSFSSKHDVSIGKNCFIAIAKILGGVKIKDNVFIGANAVCLPKSITQQKYYRCWHYNYRKYKSGSTVFSGLGKKIN